MANRHPDLTDALVGSNIRLLRIARHMSQTTLAERLGITFQQVQKYEQGMNRIGSSRLVRIAEVFGLPIEDLFEGTSERQHARRPSPLHLIADREPYRLVEAFARIKNRRVRRAIVSLVERLAE